MNKRVVALLSLAAVVGALVVYDYLPAERRAKAKQEQTPASPPDTYQQARALVKGKEGINRAYGNAAVAYAEMAANLRTFAYETEDPRKMLQTLLREELPSDVALDDLLIGEPVKLAEGVHTLKANIKLRAASARSAFEVLWTLGDAAYGSTWEAFSLHRGTTEGEIELVGELRAVVVQSLE